MEVEQWTQLQQFITTETSSNLKNPFTEKQDEHKRSKEWIDST